MSLRPVDFFTFPNNGCFPSEIGELEISINQNAEELLEEGKELTGKNKERYGQMIRREKEILLKKIRELQTKGLPVHMIRQAMNSSLIEWTALAQRFREESEEVGQINMDVDQELSQLETYTRSRGDIEFPDFTPPSNSFAKNQEDSLSDMKMKFTLLEGIGPLVSAPTVPYVAAKEEILEGMMIVNVMSMPFRAMNVVVGGLVHLAASTHPIAQAAIKELSGKVHDGWHGSSLGKNWNEIRGKTIENFDRSLNISREDTAYFLDSFEELALAGVTLGVGSIAKSAIKTAKRFTAQIKGKNSGCPVIEDIYFKKETKSEAFFEHPVASEKGVEGFIDFHYVRGSNNSVLIYLDYIQKGKVYDWNVSSSQSLGHTPYSTSQAALSTIKEIGEKMGCERIFLQFEPVNQKFHAYVEKNYPLKSDYPASNSLGEVFGPYPLFELSEKTASTIKKYISIVSPFAFTEGLHTLSSKHANDMAH